MIADYCEHCNATPENPCDLKSCSEGCDAQICEEAPSSSCPKCAEYTRQSMADALRDIGGLEWHLWNDRRLAKRKWVNYGQTE